MRKTRNALAAVLAAILVLLIVPLLAPGRAPLGLLLQGVETGAVNGLLALGLVLTYRANRVINFSYGAMGALAGTVGLTLYLGQHWNWYLALVAGVASGALLGVTTELLLRWRFTKVPRLIVMVATIGLAQVFGGIQALVPGWLGAPAFVGSFTTPLSRLHTTINPVLFDGNDLLVFAVALVIPLALSWFLARTDTGVAVRSLAENPDRARLVGIPWRRISLLVWILAGALAGLTVMVNSPSQGVSPSLIAGPTLLLPALVAAVIANMESLPVAFWSGIALGVINAVVGFNVTQASVTDVALLAFVLLAMLVRRGRSGRGREEGTQWLATGVARPIPPILRRLPEVRLARVGLGLAVAAVVLLVPVLGGPGTTLEYTVALTFGILAVSLVVLSGWGGTVSLGQFSLAGAGGILAGDLIEKANVDLFQCLALAAVAGAILAGLVGLPALRARGEFLAVSTLALAVCTNSFFFNPANFSSLIPGNFVRPVVFGHLNLVNGRTLYYLCLAVLVAVVLFVVGLRKARAGRVLLAVRDNPEAASAMGVPTVRTTLSAFMLSGAIAGIAGALYVTTLRSVGDGSFDPSLSLLVFSMAVIGGLGSISGALIGVTLVEIATYGLPQYQSLIAGAGMLLVLMIVPGGLGRVLEMGRDVLLRAVARRHNLDVPTIARQASHLPAQTDADAIPASTSLTLVAHATDDATSERPLLVCTGVEASYGPVQILFGIDLAVQRGEVVALLGTNGAGKSTLLRAMSGLLDLGAGQITLGDARLDRLAPETTVSRGMSLMPGGRGTFPALTVAENLRLSAWLIRKDPARVRAARQRQLELFPVLADRLGQRASDLSGGEQQMLSLAMALMIEPDVLLIDELSLGLAPMVVSQLLDVLRDLHAQGTTIVLVEQSINVALEIAERAIFMEKGEVRFSGASRELLDRPDLLRSVFIAGGIDAGQHNGAPRPRPIASDEDAAPRIVLTCRDVSKRFGGVTAANQINFSLQEGEILGLIGHNGAGKTTLMDMISGFTRLDHGVIVFEGMDIGLLPPHQRAAMGLGRTFQNAMLFPSLTVHETIAVSYERHLASRDLVASGLRLPASLDSEAEVAEDVAALIALTGLEPYAENLVGELSTGTRRIVELACVVAQKPAVLLLDEPTGGVAQRETEAMGPLLLRVKQQTGCSILVVEHDMSLLAAICDRLVALELGEVIAEGQPGDVLNHPRVIDSYLGTDQATIARSDLTAVGTAAP
ncbi:MAG TPA: ATP-binding cassette domain-containing protein [Acidimicrobiales bacterium]|jgi:ABC-type branched-subunit amino acid transport system ATPase component/ABC-type branched-subunit amino acid transport system permease subunit